MCHYEILDLSGRWEPMSVSGFLLHETGDGRYSEWYLVTPKQGI